jgi:hypothetical protein
VQEAGRLAAQILHCPQPSRDTEAQARCESVLLHAVARLLRALFVCHARSAVEAGVLEDAACEGRAESAYAVALTAAGPACQHCPPPKFVTPLARSVVAGVYNEIFCLAD